MDSKNFLVLVYFGCAISLSLSSEDARGVEFGDGEEDLHNQRRFRRIVVTPVKTGKTNADGDIDYPEGFYIPPGVTEEPEVYDYDVKKFNQSYLTNESWRNPVRNKTIKYKATKSSKSGLVNSPVDVDGVDVLPSKKSKLPLGLK